MHLAGYNNFVNMGVRQEMLHTLPGLRCVWLDDAAILADFPGLATHAFENYRSVTERRTFLGAWMARMAGVISKGQLVKNDVNTDIRIGQTERRAFRPARYGRSAVVTVPNAAGQVSGLLDVKGCGIEPGRKPVHGEHRNGLFSLSQAFEEIVVQRLVAHVLGRELPPLTCLPAYAIMLCPFNLKWQGGGEVPAGFMVRRAHLRHPNGVELPSSGTALQRAMLQIEFALRRYGLTSASPGSRLEIFEDDGKGLAARYAGFPLEATTQQLSDALAKLGRKPPVSLDGVNLQYAAGLGVDPPTGMIVDFGHFQLCRQFENPLLSLVNDRPLMWGGWLGPDDPKFVQPDPDIAFDDSLWQEASAPEQQQAQEIFGPETQVKGIISETHDIALGCAAGDLDAQAVEARLSAMLTDIIQPTRTCGAS